MTPFEMRVFLTTAEECLYRGSTFSWAVADKMAKPCRSGGWIIGIISDKLCDRLGWMKKWKRDPFRISLTARGREIYDMLSGHDYAF